MAMSIGCLASYPFSRKNGVNLVAECRVVLYAHTWFARYRSQDLGLMVVICAHKSAMGLLSICRWSFSACWRVVVTPCARDRFTFSVCPLAWASPALEKT